MDVVEFERPMRHASQEEAIRKITAHRSVLVCLHRQLVPERPRVCFAAEFSNEETAHREIGKEQGNDAQNQLQQAPV